MDLAVVTNLVDDTMVKAHELHCELEKSLEFLAMLYTSQPWWKLEHRQVEGRYVPFKDGRRATTEEWFVYNGTDCCVTYEVNQAMEAKLKPQQRAHYQWQVSLLTPLAYMSLRGLRFDSELAAQRLKTTCKKSIVTRPNQPGSGQWEASPPAVLRSPLGPTWHQPDYL
jgi:hypothetical protein